MTSMDSRRRSSSTSIAFVGPCSSMYFARELQHSTTQCNANLQATEWLSSQIVLYSMEGPGIFWERGTKRGFAWEVTSCAEHVMRVSFLLKAYRP